MAMFNINMIGQVIPLGCVRHCADCLDIKNIIDRDLRFSPERSHRQPPDSKRLESGRKKTEGATTAMNIICICLDTFRADIIGEGKKYSHVETPNLDAFHRNSIRFNRAFGEGQPTLQVRRGLFTGMRSFPWRYNFDRRGHWHHAPGWHKIPPNQDTIAEVLLERGVLSAMVSDTYHMFKPTMNFSRGFAHLDFIRGQESDNWKSGDPRLIEEQLKKHVRSPLNWPRHTGLVNYLLNQRHRQSKDDYQCARVFSAASEWLKDNYTAGPFFLWVDSFDPHEPWDPPKAYADRYFPDYDGPDFIVPNAAHEGEGPTDDERRRSEALYLGEVTFVDECVGRFLNTVENLKIGDETMVVILSDHGTQLLDQGKFGKGPDELHPFNTQLNLMMRVPDGPSNVDVDAFVQNHDLMPTLLHRLGVPCDWTDGEDLWPLVTGEKSSIRDRIVTGWAGFVTGNGVGRASVRDDRWNFCTAVGYNDDAGDELFDIINDPNEVHNVASNHPDVVSRRRTDVEAVIGQPLPGHMVEVCDPAPGPMVRWLEQKLLRIQ